MSIPNENVGLKKESAAYALLASKRFPWSQSLGDWYLCLRITKDSGVEWPYLGERHVHGIYNYFWKVAD